MIRKFRMWCALAALLGLAACVSPSKLHFAKHGVSDRPADSYFYFAGDGEDDGR